jgi:hypothetical protein
VVIDYDFSKVVFEKVKHIYLKDKDKAIDKILDRTYVKFVDEKFLVLFPDDRLTINPERLSYHETFSSKMQFLYYVISSSVELTIRDYNKSFKKVNKEELYNRVKDMIKNNIYMDYINSDCKERTTEAERQGFDI